MGEYDIAELAKLGGVSRRTVRYYVQRGLIPKPTGTGRGRHYDDAHLAALTQVREAQERGESLASLLVHPPADRPEVTVPTGVWQRVRWDARAELHLRGMSLDVDDVAALQNLIATIVDKNRH